VPGDMYQIQGGRVADRVHKIQGGHRSAQQAVNRHRVHIKQGGQVTDVAYDNKGGPGRDARHLCNMKMGLEMFSDMGGGSPPEMTVRLARVWNAGQCGRAGRT
jgi:hypothetical protein